MLMARYRKVDSRIWNDEKFRRLGDDAKLVFFMLLTHPNMTALGAMRATLAGLSEELGWKPEAFKEAFRKVLSEGMAEHDARACFIALPNFLRYNPPESPNVVKAWVGAIDLLPECELKNRVITRSKAFTHGMTEAFRKALPEAFLKGMPYQEQEQEQEQEKTVPNGTSSPAKLPTCPTQVVVDLYHEVLPCLPKVRLVNVTRTRAISSLWRFVLTTNTPEGIPRATSANEALAWIRTYFERASKNDFLMGRGPKSVDHAGWECDIDFLMSQKGMKQVIEKTRTP
jgi:hypothetical protein